MRRFAKALALVVPALLVAPLAAADDDAAPAPAASAPPAATSGPSASQIAAKVQAFYNQTKTYQADFKQEYTVKMHNQKKTSDGHVVFEKPGKMSWTYNQPNGNRVVSDGKTLKVYEKDNQQMFEQPVDKSQYPAALAFLMGQGDLEKSFALRSLDASKMGVEGAYVLEGTPKEGTPAYQKVLLYVDMGTSQVLRVLILDAQGNKNRFDFSNVTVNTPVPPGDFNFTPPAGTQVVHP